VLQFVDFYPIALTHDTGHFTCCFWDEEAATNTYGIVEYDRRDRAISVIEGQPEIIDALVAGDAHDDFHEAVMHNRDRLKSMS
jgi:hypothetical protein